MPDDLIRRSSVIEMIKHHCQQVGSAIRHKHTRDIYEAAHNQLIEAVELIPAVENKREDDEERT